MSSKSLSLTSTIAYHVVVYVVCAKKTERRLKADVLRESTRPNFEEQGPTIVVPSESVSLTPGFCTSCMVAYSED